VGQAAHLPEGELMGIVGEAAGRHLHAIAHNRDPRPVRDRRGRRRSFGAQSALGRAEPRGRREVEAVLVGLVDRVTRRMRAAGRSGRTVVLRLRFDGHTSVTRSRTLARPTSASMEVLAPARDLLAEAMPEVARRGLTLVGVQVSGLDDGGAQLALALDDPRGGAIDAALDAVRHRFGPAAVTRGSLVGRDPGLASWMLPHDRRAPSGTPGRGGGTRGAERRSG
jgi:DNA polymerase-4